MYFQLWNDKHKPEQVEEELKNILKNLNLDYLDLFLIHWPFATNVRNVMVFKLNVIYLTKFLFQEDLNDCEGRILGADVSYLDTWKAMERCVQLGLTKSIGISNFNIKQVKDILEIATIKPVVNQVMLKKC